MFKLMQGASALTLATMLTLGPVPVFAQTATDDATGTDAPTGGETAQETVIPPAGGETDTAEEMVPSVEGAADTDTAQTAPLPPAEGAGTEAVQVVVEPVEGTIRMQDENTVLASDLMGARIFNSAEEVVGDVDDVIVSIDGIVDGVVIGVGGFLGIGEKKVAVEMSALSVRMDEEGNPRLLLDATREALEAAPEFVTVAEQANEAEIEDVQPTMGTTGTEGGTEAAPPAADQ